MHFHPFQIRRPFTLCTYYCTTAVSVGKHIYYCSRMYCIPTYEIDTQGGHFLREKVSAISYHKASNTDDPNFRWQGENCSRLFYLTERTKKWQCFASTKCSRKPLFCPVPVLTNFWPPRIFFVKTQRIRNKPSNFTNFLSYNQIILHKRGNRKVQKNIILSMFEQKLFNLPC